jgi:hypothetical protein
MLRQISIAVFGLVVLAAIGWYRLAASAQGADESRIVGLKAEILFAPKGFDDNDQVEVVLDGWLASSCDKLGETKFKLDRETLTIAVEATATREPGVCMPVLSPFTAVVAIGHLPMGDYKVVANGGELAEDLPITEATSAGPDDYTYANVTNAFVDFAPDAKSDSRYSVVVEGQFTDSCQKIEELRVIDSGKTFEVLPIIGTDGEECLPVMRPFAARGQMPEFTEDGRYLLHVRKHNGQALNKVFSVKNPS